MTCRSPTSCDPRSLWRATPLLSGGSPVWSPNPLRSSAVLEGDRDCLRLVRWAWSSDQRGEGDAFGQPGLVDANLVVVEGPCGCIPRALGGDSVQELAGGCFAVLVIVGEDVQAAHVELAAGGGEVVIEHEGERTPEHGEVVAGDAGAAGEGALKWPSPR